MTDDVDGDRPARVGVTESSHGFVPARRLQTGHPSVSAPETTSFAARNGYVIAVTTPDGFTIECYSVDDSAQWIKLDVDSGRGRHVDRDAVISYIRMCAPDVLLVRPEETTLGGGDFDAE